MTLPTEKDRGVNWIRNSAIWIATALLLIVPLIATAMSPLLAWRNPIYIGAGFAGVIGLCLLLLQPMLAGGILPGLSPPVRLRVHRMLGGALVLSLLVHLVGLWVTSPPDVIDALLFASATSFSIWGVIAMWSVIVTALSFVFRRKLRVSASAWRVGHRCLAAVTVVGSVVHALMIEGAMELFSKAALCVCVIVATGLALYKSVKC